MRVAAAPDRRAHPLSREPDRRRRALLAIASAALVTAAGSVAPLDAAGPTLERLDAGLPREGQWRNGFDVADVDGDGHPDLVHGPPRRGRGGPLLFRGDGRGGFAQPIPLRLPDLPFDYGDAGAADLDGDGRTDLAFAVHLGGLVALVASAEGDFVAAPGDLRLLPPGEADFTSRALELGDWNRDSRIDLVALGEGPARGLPDGRRGLAVFLNLEEGWRRLSGPPEKSFGDALAIADLNGDGRLDAVVASRRLGDRGILRLQDDKGSWSVGSIEELRSRAYLPSVAVLAAADGEPPTLAISWVEQQQGTWSSGIDLLRRSAEGWLRLEIDRRPGAVEIGALAAGDLDGDGRVDLVAGDATGRVDVYVGTADGGLDRRPRRALERAGAGCAARHARLTDLDHDDRPELLLAFASEPSAEGCVSGGSLQAWRVRR